MRFTWLVLLGAAACKGEDTDTDVQVDCTLERTMPVSSVAVTEWPEGLQEALTALTDLDGRWTADACGTQINVSIRTPPAEQTGSLVDIVTLGLPAGNTCGCTIDASEGKDGDLTIIGYSMIDVAVENYPNEGFREESAGNVSDLRVALFNEPSGLKIRGCTTRLVPPVIGVDWTDTEFVFRSGTAGVSGNVRMYGEGVADDVCPLTNWERIGNN